MTEPPTARPSHVVIDASAVVALLTDAGPAGEWVAGTIAGAALSAPALMPYEVTNVLRRRTASDQLDTGSATLAHRDLVVLPVDYYPYSTVADRVWQLRDNLTAYDAAYVSLAELLAAPLVTLDARMARAAGPACPVLAFRPVS